MTATDAPHADQPDCCPAGNRRLPAQTPDNHAAESAADDHDDDHDSQVPGEPSVQLATRQRALLRERGIRPA